MSVTYDKIFRQVCLKGNLLRSESAALFETYYTDPEVGATQMLERASEFPKSAIDDCILAAGDRLVRAIGKHPTSPYRKDFTDQTNPLQYGEKIPTFSQFGFPIVGVIGAVRDVDTDEEFERADSRQQITDYNALILKSDVRMYWTDNVRVWATGANREVVCDVVVWSKDDERAKLVATPTRGDCLFTEDLHEALVVGALGTLMRGTFNDSQVTGWATLFDNSLKEIEAAGVLS